MRAFEIRYRTVGFVWPRGPSGAAPTSSAGRSWNTRTMKITDIWGRRSCTWSLSDSHRAARSGGPSSPSTTPQLHTDTHTHRQRLDRSTECTLCNTAVIILGRQSHSRQAALSLVQRGKLPALKFFQDVVQNHELTETHHTQRHATVLNDNWSFIGN